MHNLNVYGLACKYKDSIKVFSTPEATSLSQARMSCKICLNTFVLFK